MTGRPYTRADYLAIKSATRRACEDAGPLHEIAANTRCDATLLSRYGNAERPEFIPIDIAMDLDAMSGGDRILKAWAEARGYELVRDERGVAVEQMNRHIADVGVEAGELISEMCNAAGDGITTPREAQAVSRRVSDLKDSLIRLDGDMRRIQVR